MQKYGVAAMCMAVLLLMHGCASAPKKDTAMSMAQLRNSYEELLSAPEDNEKGDRIISRARTMIGMPYVRGGRNPGGFDCSGLVQWAYKNEGISLPRTAREQSQVGTRITDVEEMRAGAHGHLCGGRQVYSQSPPARPGEDQLVERSVFPDDLSRGAARERGRRGGDCPGAESA